MKSIGVDMTNKSIRVDQVSEECVGLVGKGLTSIMINTEVPPSGFCLDGCPKRI